TPTVAALKQKTPASIVDALTSGVMRQQGSELTDVEKRTVADYLGAAPATAASAGACRATPPFDPSKEPSWTAWSPDSGNTRFPTAEQAGISAAQVPKLTLKWAFGFPNQTTARALPTVAGGRVFVGSGSGAIYALDAKSGCTIWAYQAKAGVRTGIVIGPRTSS